MNTKRTVSTRAALGVTGFVVLSLATVQLATTGFRASASAGSGSSASSAAKSLLAADQPQIEISPGAVHVEGATSKPTSTADCEKTYHIACYEPFQIQRAYNLAPLFKKGIDGKGSTIVIVDSFGSPTIKHDLGVFDKTFHLPAPPSFNIIQPAGPIPHENAGWAGETTLDVEYSHVMAPDASILLVETPTSENEGTSGFPDIVKAEEYVINHHLGGVISQSFSATEQTFANFSQLKALRGAYIDASEHGVTVLAASGDSGAADVEHNGYTYYSTPVTSWPDSDPLVTGVGGTELHLNSLGEHTTPDTVWNDTYNVATNKYIFGNAGPNPLAGGGGKSVVFGRPSYQNGVASVVKGHRGVPDISMSGACDGGVDLYQSFKGQAPGWYVTCGTSEATPLFAGVVALADQVAGHPLGLINPALYALSASHAPGIVDVTSGNNTVTFEQDGKTQTVHGFDAEPGYDLASGVGTIDAASFVPELAKAASSSGSASGSAAGSASG
jgi:subtilase family serine protease